MINEDQRLAKLNKQNDRRTSQLCVRKTKEVFFSSYLLNELIKINEKKMGKNVRIKDSMDE